MTELAYSRQLAAQPALLEVLKEIFRATPLGIVLAVLRSRR
jgi:hypothetical protein